jgi:hypothetical protein
MGEGEEYECPDCGTSFGFGEGECPNCGVDLDWDDTEAVEIGHEPMRLVDPQLPEVSEEVVPPEAVFSKYGMVFALLTAVAFLGTLLLIRWDTWIAGAAEDSIGDDQRLLIYAGAVATIAFALMAIFDIMRGQTKATGAAET